MWTVPTRKSTRKSHEETRASLPGAVSHRAVVNQDRLPQLGTSTCQDIY